MTRLIQVLTVIPSWLAKRFTAAIISCGNLTGTISLKMGRCRRRAGPAGARRKLYILGGQWDRLAVARLPVQHPSMAVVLVIKIDYNEAPKTCTLNIELMLAGESMGVKSAGSMSIGHAAGLARGAPQFAPAAVTFNNVQFDKPGRYEWVISAGAEVLGQIPLEVVQGIEMAGPGPQSAPPPSPTE